MKGCGKILVVDDDNGVTCILQELLQEKGFQVETANSGSYGYWGIIIHQPDLILTDIQMPDISGLEMMTRIRRDYPHIKAIYMSADLDRFRLQLDREGKIYGVGIIAKPFSEQELIGLINAQLTLSA